MSIPPSLETASYPAKRFAAGALFCPDCRVRLEHPEPRCPACGFSGERTLSMFPGSAPALQEWMDHSSYWDQASQKKIMSWLAVMRRRFPQIHWCLLTISLPEHVRLRLFNFWLCNVSPTVTAEDAETRGWTILLTYDSAHNRMAITPCYQVEPLLADDEWEDLLTTVKSCMRESGILRGYREFFHHAERKLMAASLRMNAIIDRREGGDT